MAITLNFTLSQVVKNTSLQTTTGGNISSNEPIPVRVLGVILDENDKFFEDSDIPTEARVNYFGTIKFQDYNNPIYSQDTEANIALLARPINPNIKHYPLKNEIVYVLALPNQNSKNNLNTYSFYYYPPINMENNITSNPIVPTYQQSQQNIISPEEATDGISVNINADQKQVENLLGAKFPTNLSKTPSKTFEGDIMYEGRFGNSLRFSSDLYNGEGQQGEPLTILANQAGNSLIEDINRDKASVYLTTNQRITIKAANNARLDSFIPSKPTPSKASNIRPVESYTNNTEFTGPKPENTNSTSQIESQECKEIPKTWDPASDRRIASLHPLIRCDVAKIINRAERELGITFRVTQGFRTIEEQNKLYAKGRTTSGKIVTNAKGGESYHNYGLSFDVVQIKDRKALWKGESGREIEYEQLANIAKQYGFEWGGDWVSFVDKPHFQKVYNKTVSQLFALTNIPEQPYPNIA